MSALAALLDAHATPRPLQLQLRTLTSALFAQTTRAALETAYGSLLRPE